ncbi:retinol dehydrogenase 14-like [Mercenaria mercenaria]|uniref:retinol dehydrogenase 14-like n=1 Tax=Mercenaria mercenaria TaxID=6596 RepID=UPI00234F1E99|nr:retinol dehydrogenase 14-like [Mercenaria mercenaria]
MGSRASFPIVPLSEDRVIMVTGANCGLGYQIAKWAAMMGATVILACRSVDKARAAMEKMHEEFKEEKTKGTSNMTEKSTLCLEFLKVDLGSFKSVAQFCEDFKKTGRPLHVLVCNAAKLLSVMKQSGLDCRIIFNSSKAERFASFDIENISFTGTKRNYPVHSCYNQSKLYQIMQMFAMSRRLTGTNITVNSLHPGIVETEIWRYSHSWMKRCWIFIARCFCLTRTPIYGATFAIDLVVNPKHAGVSGLY